MRIDVIEYDGERIEERQLDRIEDWAGPRAGGVAWVSVTGVHDARVLEAFGIQTSLVLEYRRLREREVRAALLESAEATSTALLRAVSHDLRTPLATMRASVDGLRTADLDATDRRHLLDALGDAGEQLERLIDNLLDLSRVQAGLVRPQLVAASLDEALLPALIGLPPGAVSLEFGDDVPWVLTDPGLLERVVANLVGNAVRVSAGVPVRVLAHVGRDAVDIQIGRAHV